jgi:hypothetical protein
MKTLLSINWMLGAGIWYAVNGLLHDIFVVKAHKGGYDRELLRLLMDGHVLILSGALLLVCWQLAKVQPAFAATLGLIIAAGMVVYCAMIFPFLKSFATLLISLFLAAACIYVFFRHEQPLINAR